MIAVAGATVNGKKASQHRYAQANGLLRKPVGLCQIAEADLNQTLTDKTQYKELGSQTLPERATAGTFLGQTQQSVLDRSESHVSSNSNLNVCEE